MRLPPGYSCIDQTKTAHLGCCDQGHNREDEDKLHQLNQLYPTVTGGDVDIYGNAFNDSAVITSVTSSRKIGWYGVGASKRWHGSPPLSYSDYYESCQAYGASGSCGEGVCTCRLEDPKTSPSYTTKYLRARCYGLFKMTGATLDYPCPSSSYSSSWDYECLVDRYTGIISCTTASFGEWTDCTCKWYVSQTCQDTIDNHKTWMKGLVSSFIEDAKLYIYWIEGDADLINCPENSLQCPSEECFGDVVGGAAVAYPTVGCCGGLTSTLSTTAAHVQGNFYSDDDPDWQIEFDIVLSDPYTSADVNADAEGLLNYWNFDNIREWRTDTEYGKCAHISYDEVDVGSRSPTSGLSQCFGGEYTSTSQYTDYVSVGGVDRVTSEIYDGQIYGKPLAHTASLDGTSSNVRWDEFWATKHRNYYKEWYAFGGGCNKYLWATGSVVSETEDNCTGSYVVTAQSDIIDLATDYTPDLIRKGNQKIGSGCGDCAVSDCINQGYEDNKLNFPGACRLFMLDGNTTGYGVAPWWDEVSATPMPSTLYVRKWAEVVVERRSADWSRPCRLTGIYNDADYWRKRTNCINSTEAGEDCAVQLGEDWATDICYDPDTFEVVECNPLRDSGTQYQNSLASLAANRPYAVSGTFNCTSSLNDYWWLDTGSKWEHILLKYEYNNRDENEKSRWNTDLENVTWGDCSAESTLSIDRPGTEELTTVTGTEHWINPSRCAANLIVVTPNTGSSTYTRYSATEHFLPRVTLDDRYGSRIVVYPQQVMTHPVVSSCLQGQFNMFPKPCNMLISHSDGQATCTDGVPNTTWIEDFPRYWLDGDGELITAVNGKMGVDDFETDDGVILGNEPFNCVRLFPGRPFVEARLTMPSSSCDGELAKAFTGSRKMGVTNYIAYKNANTSYTSINHPEAIAEYAEPPEPCYDRYLAGSTLGDGCGPWYGNQIYIWDILPAQELVINNDYRFARWYERYGINPSLIYVAP